MDESQKYAGEVQLHEVLEKTKLTHVTESRSEIA